MIAAAHWTRFGARTVFMSIDDCAYSSPEVTSDSAFWPVVASGPLRMLGFAAVAFAILSVGYGLTRIIASHIEPEWIDTSEPLEVISASGLLGGSLWIATSWALALAGLLTRGSLLVAASIFIVAGAVLLLRSGRALHGIQIPRRTAFELAALLPVVVWLGFILWRGTILPPLSHDALSYHLPKAVMMARAHAFRYFEAPDLRISHLPANYELLLADTLLMGGSDRLTEWIGTLMFCFFLAAAGAIAQRWWRSTLSAVPVVLVVASAPVVLLHSGADKNDLMIGVLALHALTWGARWTTEGGAFSLLLTTAALTAGGGTKPQQGAILLGLAPFLLLRAIGEIRADRRALVRFGAIGIGAVLWFVLTGGAAYVANALHESTPISMEIGATAVDETNAMFQWGDWHNLWQFPVLLFLVAFSPEETAVWVPWRGEYWFWPEFELYFSHFGTIGSLLLLALPVGVWWFRGQGRTRERSVLSIAALIAVALILPVQFRPVGAFASFPRYIIYALPLIACWTVAPLYRKVSAHRIPTAILLTALAGALSISAVRVATRDQFAPLPYVLWTAQNPGSREIFISPNRAASVVDRAAGPTDRIAIDAAFDSWLYPAYGRDLSREIVFLPQARPDRPAIIPPDVRWVLVDRSWTALWGHPMLTDMGRFWKYRARGTPREKDLAIYQQLLADPRFALVFRDFRRNQAVFWRKVEGQPVPYLRRVRFQTPVSSEEEVFYP